MERIASSAHHAPSPETVRAIGLGARTYAQLPPKLCTIEHHRGVEAASADEVRDPRGSNDDFDTDLNPEFAY